MNMPRFTQVLPGFDRALIRGALRIGAAVQLRRHERAMLEGSAWAQYLLGDLITEEIVARAIAATIAIEDVPVEVALAAARTTLLCGRVFDQDVETLVSRMRQVIRSGGSTLRLASPPIDATGCQKSVGAYQPIEKLQPANDCEVAR